MLREVKLPVWLPYQLSGKMKLLLWKRPAGKDEY